MLDVKIQLPWGETLENGRSRVFKKWPFSSVFGHIGVTINCKTVSVNSCMQTSSKANVCLKVVMTIHCDGYDVFIF